MKLTINTSTSFNVDFFAYDNHHKFYLLNNGLDIDNAEDEGLDIYHIDNLPELWANSSSLRYICSYAKDDDGRRQMIVPQYQDVTSFIIDGKEYVVDELVDDSLSNGFVL